MWRIWELDIEGRPRSKLRPRKGKGNRFYTPPETRRWQEHLAWCWVEKFGGPVFPRDLPLIVGAKFTFRKGRLPDGDNLYKLVLDALQGVAYEDDSRVAAGIWWRPPERSEDRTRIVIAPYLPSAMEEIWGLLEGD